MNICVLYMIIERQVGVFINVGHSPSKREKNIQEPIGAMNTND